MNQHHFFLNQDRWALRSKIIAGPASLYVHHKVGGDPLLFLPLLQSQWAEGAVNSSSPLGNFPPQSRGSSGSCHLASDPESLNSHSELTQWCFRNTRTTSDWSQWWFRTRNSLNVAQVAFPWDFLTGNNKRYICFSFLVMIIKSIFKQMSDTGAPSSCLKPLTETKQS